MDFFKLEQGLSGKDSQRIADDIIETTSLITQSFASVNLAGIEKGIGDGARASAERGCLKPIIREARTDAHGTRWSLEVPPWFEESREDCQKRLTAHWDGMQQKITEGIGP